MLTFVLVLKRDEMQPVIYQVWEMTDPGQILRELSLVENLHYSTK